MANLAHKLTRPASSHPKLKVITGGAAKCKVIATLPHARVLRDGDHWTVQVSIEAAPASDADWRVVYRRQSGVVYAGTPPRRRDRIERDPRAVRRECVQCMRYASAFWSIYAPLYRRAKQIAAHHHEPNAFHEAALFIIDARIALSQLAESVRKNWKRRAAWVPYAYVLEDEHWTALVYSLIALRNDDPYAFLPGLRGNLGPHYERN